MRARKMMCARGNLFFVQTNPHSVSCVVDSALGLGATVTAGSSLELSVVRKEASHGTARVTLFFHAHDHHDSSESLHG